MLHADDRRLASPPADHRRPDPRLPHYDDVADDGRQHLRLAELLGVQPAGDPCAGGAPASHALDSGSVGGFQGRKEAGVK